MKRDVGFRIGGQERRRQRVRVVAVAVASVLAANGAVAFERVTQRNVSAVLADVINSARHAAAEAIRPDDGDQVASPAARPGPERTSPTSTGDPTALGGTATPDSGGPGTGSYSSATDGASPRQTSPGRTSAPAPTGPAVTSPRADAPSSSPTAVAAPPSLTNRTVTPATPGIDDGFDDPVSTSAPGTPGPTPTAPPPGETLPELVRRLGAYVEQARGLQFRAPVPARVAGAAEFKQRYLQHVNIPSGEAARLKQGVFRALGVIGPDVDLAGEMTRLAIGYMPPAFYDPRVGEILVHEGGIDAYTRSMLVRALTKALDDQRVEIYRPNLGTVTDPAADAFAGLVEGAARWVASSYEASVPAGEQAEINAERRRRAALVPKDVPPGIRSAYNLPAKSGPTLVAALVGVGGTARLNAAFAAPPSTTEHLLLPAKYLAGEGAKPVAAPAAGGSVVTRGSVGHMGLLLMLAGVAPNDQVSRAARGWAGDQYVAWQNGGQTCVRASVHMETPEDSSQLGGVLNQWAAQRSGTVEGSGPFAVTRCG